MLRDFDAARAEARSLGPSSRPLDAAGADGPRPRCARSPCSGCARGCRSLPCCAGGRPLAAGLDAVSVWPRMQVESAGGHRRRRGHRPGAAGRHRRDLHRLDDHADAVDHAVAASPVPPRNPRGVERTADSELRRMLQARALTKRYGGLLALDRVSFDLHPGEIVGYLGPNGSGKSTTVNLVVGLLEPSAGSISLDDVSLTDRPDRVQAPDRLRARGAVPLRASHGVGVPDAGRPAPRHHRRGRSRRRSRRLLHLFQLHDSRYKSMTAFSKGMRQRVLVAAALLHDPRPARARRAVLRASTSTPACCSDRCSGCSPTRAG